MYIHTEYEMSFSDDDDLDHILAGADYVEPDQAMLEPGPTPELLGAVESPTDDAVSVEGMAPREGSEGELRIGEELQIGEGLCQWPSPCFSQAGEFICALISDMCSTTSVYDRKTLCAYKRICAYKRYAPNNA